MTHDSKIIVKRKDQPDFTFICTTDRLSINLMGPWLVVNEILDRTVTDPATGKSVPKMFTRFIAPEHQILSLIVLDEPSST